MGRRRDGAFELSSNQDILKYLGHQFAGIDVPALREKIPHAGSEIAQVPSVSEAK